MNKLKLFLGLLAVLTLASCTFRTGNPAENDPSSEISPDESTAEYSANPEIESQDNPIQPLPTLVMAPAEGTPGAYFADSFASLQTIIESDDFLSYPQRPVLCITEAFELDYPLQVQRDTDLIYLPETCAWSYTLTICGDQVPSLQIVTAAENLLTEGLLIVEAPYTSLEVIGIGADTVDALFLYSNVAACNGIAKNCDLGGYGKEQLLEATLKSSETGQAYDGVFLTVQGNWAVLHVPLVVPEQDLKSASVSFVTTSGAVISPEGMDLTGDNHLTLTDTDGQTRIYHLTAQRLSYELPVMEIHTDDGAEIADKINYVHGTLTIDGVSYSMKIRGRGNASWTYFPKKSYRIKLDESASLFGLPENKDWVLASNYADKTMIRNCVAHTIASSLSGLAYTSTHFPVNLYLNGEYWGVYTFADKIEDGNGRLDLGKTVADENGVQDVGFLVEIGWDFDKENIYNQDYFDAEKVVRIFVKEPDIPQANTPEFLYLKSYILNAEKAIIENDGWEDYIDVDSWIDWMIVNELTFNTESSFYRSCYLWRPVGGKLHLGPVWDFDMAFGNHYGDLPGYDGWCTTESTYEYLMENWMNYLMRYPAFTDRLVSRWNEVKDQLLVTALDAVDQYAAMLDGSQQQNYLVWNNLNIGVGMASVNPYVYDTYDKQVQYLRDFINTRWSYIDTRLNSEEYCPGDSAE